MSVVNILNIQVLDNPSRFTNPFQFEITFECTSPLKADLEWKIIYVGSAEDERYDQTLDCIMADAPDTRKIPPADIIGVTVVLLTCSYQGQEFVRVGYYVNNEYDEETLALMNNPDSTVNDTDNHTTTATTVAAADKPQVIPQVEHLIRNILADKPRVTRFPIKWDAVDELEPPPPQPDLPIELTANPGSWDDDNDNNNSESNNDEDDDDEEEEGDGEGDGDDDMEGGDDMAVTSEMDADETVEESEDDDDKSLIHSTPEHQSINHTNIFGADAKLRDPFVDPLKKTTMDEERQMSVD